MSNTPVNINSLDFDVIKDDIKTFLGGQTEFTDYDFDGSGMSVLLDILAYVTFYMSLQSNMSFSEMFADTANLRNSLISRVKEQNYIPSQKAASVAVIKLSVTDNVNQPASVLVPKGTIFSSLKDDVVYYFVTTKEEVLVNIGNFVYEADIEISQGEFRTASFIADNTTPNQRFTLPDDNVDTSFLEVSVKQIGDTFKLWRNEKNISLIQSKDTVWFYQEGADKKIEVYFGEGLIGLKPITGEDIKCEYLITAGIVSNGIGNFALTTNVQGYSINDFTITTIIKSQQGSDEESIESIKLLAPKLYQAQNRAVTESDYRAIVLEQFPIVQTMNVWGGEKEVPAQYGKVFMSIKPNHGKELTPATKISILDYIKKFNVVGITVEIVDPEFIYVNVSSAIKYRGLDTNLGDAVMISLVQAGIASYIDSQSANFGDNLYFSSMVTEIDNLEKSIESNLTDLTLSSRFIATPFASQAYTFNYSNEIKQFSLTSTWTGTNGNLYALSDNGQGVIYLYKDGVLLINNQGSVNYSTGTVNINDLKADVAPNTTISVQVTPLYQDLKPSRRTLFISGDLTNVTVNNISVQ